jgi:hypothetical protein
MPPPTLRYVPESALIDRVADYLQTNAITRPPDWLMAACTDSDRNQLTAWWYHQAAYHIYHFHRTPMLPPQLPPCRKTGALTSIIAQFASLGWLHFDRTGLILVSKQFETLLSELTATE